MLQFAKDERLEQLKRHLLRQTALVQTQGRTDHDHRTTGVVYALTQQVLTEATLLTFNHVCQRLQRTLVGTRNGTTTTTVVQQRVNRLLQHTLLVPHDNIGRRQVQQTLQTVVTVDNTAIQIVQIRGREAATVQRYQRTQIRRQNWQYGHDHPLWLVAGAIKGFHQLQTLGQLLDFGLGGGLRNFFAQLANLVSEIHRGQQFINSLGAHASVEIITELFQRFEILLIVQQLTLVQGSHARLDNHVALEIKYALDITQGHIQQQADT